MVTIPCGRFLVSLEDLHLNQNWWAAMTMKRLIFCWALAGVLVPAALLIADRYAPARVLYPLYSAWLILFPSGFLLFGFDGPISSAFEWFMIIYSIGINGCIYGAVGGIVWKMYRWLAETK